MVSYNRALLKHLPELIDIQRAVQHAPRGMVDVEILAELRHKDLVLPLLSLTIGSRDPGSPTFLLVAGVHGLERIGTRVANSFVKTLINLARWDKSIQSLLATCRLVVVPIVNPIGMYLGRRSNGNGVDLMRNSPVDADIGTSPLLAGGHRISARIPWYRGLLGAPMEVEAMSICHLVEEKLALCQQLLILDVHSGFGAVDRLWFPYAKTAAPFPNLVEVYNLSRLLDKTYPHHIYKVEPQAKSYTTNGDLWDYLYDRNLSKTKGDSLRTIIPLTLELGSWLWIKKNPIQALTALGIFNPLLPHRTQRILRRHQQLLDFLLRATAAPQAWIYGDLDTQKDKLNLAKERWYKKLPK